MRDFRNYDVWKLAHKLTLTVYSLTEDFPKSEVFGLRSQLRRAAYSVPTNIAEGCGREGDVEFKRFLIIASGSASELFYLLILTNDLKLIPEKDFKQCEDDLTHLRKSIHQLIKKIKTDI
jgi:four helix bundle protein